MSPYSKTPTTFEIYYDFTIQLFEFCVILCIFIICIKIFNCNYDLKNTDLSQLDFICDYIEWFGQNLRKDMDDTHGWFTPLNI